MSPRVTVLMAVRDGGDLLREAVASILGQTFTDFELVLVDDASVDGAIERLPADPRIRILRNQRNLGQVPSLNLGLVEARGEYVARLDADDAMLPTRLARQVAALDAEPRVALVGTWMDVVDERGRLYAKLRGHIRDYAELVLAVLVDHYPFAHPSLMYRRSVVRSLGGYDASLAPSEDKDLYRRLALDRHEARCVEEPLVRYRRHERQLSQEQRETQLAHDHEGQERFLSELVGADAAPSLRVLLAKGVGDAALLDMLLVGASRRLHLDEDELEQVANGLARHVARRAVAAGPAGRDALLWAGPRWRYAPLARPVLPLVPPTRRAGSRLRDATHAFPRLRRLARHSRWLRWVYARLG